MQVQRSSAGLSNPQILYSSPSVPSISKTIRGDSVFYIVNGPFSVYNDHLGQHIRFPQCPHLTFPSMESAFGYFEKLAKSQKLQRAVEVSGLPIGYPKIPDPCERTWELKSSLEPSDVKPVVRLPTHLYGQIRGPGPEPAPEAVSQGTRKAPAVQPTSRSSPLQVPPQTLFAESTPHAQEIQAQPRVALPVKGLGSWPYHSQVTSGSYVQPSRPSPPLLKQKSALRDYHKALDIYQYLSSSSSSSLNDEMLAQPQSSYNSCPLPPSYAATVFPKTLAKKDKRVLGVSLTANIDEYVPVHCSRLFQSKGA